MNDVQFIMCALCEKKRLKYLVNQKRKSVIFSSMFFLCICFWLKACLDMCFDNLIKIYVSHHYYTIQAI